jgi:hypothetical protein
MPASISTTFSVGSLSNTPSKIRLISSACCAWAWPTISSRQNDLQPLLVIGQPP